MKQIWITALIVFFCGCSGMKPQDFAAITPELRPENYFAQPRLGQGVFYDRFGNVKLRFSAKLSGTWDGNVLTLKEILTYDSGETVNREYQIKRIDEHRYELNCSDLDGPGTIEAYGNALKWTYSLKQKIGSRIWVLHFDDWMFLQPEGGLVLNRAVARKFGVVVGEVLMVVQ